MLKNILIIIAALFGFGFPIALSIYWHKKSDCKYRVILTGAICFVLFSSLLEAMIHLYFLMINEKTATFINSSPIIYALYGGLMAGIFEETGRLFGFGVLLKKQKDKNISIGYGIGHGGIECIITLGSAYLLYSIVVCGGSLGDASADAQALQTIESIQTSIIPLAIIERISAIMLHIGLSVFVFKAVREKKKFYYYILAILIHAICDIPAALYQTGVIKSVLLVEILVFIMGLSILMVGLKMYKKIENEIALPKNARKILNKE